MRQEAGRPAFYALRPGGWRDYVTLLHPPYTAWHLSYVAVGACLATRVDASRLLWSLAAFALALGIGAHALDELQGRPLGTRIPRGVLVALAASSIAGAVAIGTVAALVWTPWLLVFVGAGAFLVCAYNLELFGGRFHSDLWFALAWGAFPLLTAFFAQEERLRPVALLGALFAALLSAAQRALSSQVRWGRRRVAATSGEVVLDGGERVDVTRATLIAAPEAALRLLALATLSLAATLLVLRLA